MEQYKNRPLSAIPSRQDDRDYRPGLFVAVAQGATDDIMLDHLPAIYDQGQDGMCVAFAGGGNRESQQYRETGVQKRMSPGFIYGNRDPDAGEYCGEGMQAREACARMVKDGVCAWEEMPILGNYATCHAYLVANSIKLRPKALVNRSQSYVRGFTEDEVYTMLKTGMGPVMITYAVYANFNRTGSDGIVSDRLPTDQLRGYHEMLVVGRKAINGRRRWVTHNSWGTGWGDKGRCYIAVDSPDIIEAWGITDYILGVTNIVMDCEPVIIPPGRMAAPIKYLAEALGGTATWNQDTQTATFAIPPKEKPVIMEVTIGDNILKVR